MAENPPVLFDDRYERASNKGKKNGYASLGATALVPTRELGTGTADATTFLRGDGTWAVVETGPGDTALFAQVLVSDVSVSTL